MDKRKNVFIILLLILQVVVLIVFCNIDRIKLIHGGLRYQLYNMNYSILFETINDDIIIDINKEKLDLNKNKVVYENDGCKIVLDSIIKEREKYILYFSSHGIYNQDFGRLVTGVKHYASSSKEVIDEIHALCFIDNVECQVNSLSALNFKDGDEFSFIIDAKTFENGQKIILKNLLLIKMEKII